MALGILMGVVLAVVLGFLLALVPGVVLRVVRAVVLGVVLRVVLVVMLAISLTVVAEGIASLEAVILQEKDFLSTFLLYLNNTSIFFAFSLSFFGPFCLRNLTEKAQRL